MESDVTETVNQINEKKIAVTVCNFTDEMEEAMIDNVDKGDWDALATKYLLSKIDHHRDMLLLSLEMSQTVKTPELIKKRCVNIANYAMMLHSQV